MFKPLFQGIFSGREDNDPVKVKYNLGVQSLARGNLQDAIDKFKSICEQHSSAAYNLGLIYLDGNGQIVPNYELARKYLTLANNMGHPKAAMSAAIIGLEIERKLSIEEYVQAFQHALLQYIQGGQLGNLAYLIAYDIKRNILETSTNELYSLDRFLSYEVWCIRNFANDEVNSLYKNSNLIHYTVNYSNDWDSGETAVISDYLNTKTFPLIIGLSQGNLKLLKLDEMGTLRLAAVNAVYKYYLN